MANNDYNPSPEQQAAQDAANRALAAWLESDAALAMNPYNPGSLPGGVHLPVASNGSVTGLAGIEGKRFNPTFTPAPRAGKRGR